MWTWRRYDRTEVFANWYEAEAWCRWAKRRLPTEARRSASRMRTAAVFLVCNGSGLGAIPIRQNDCNTEFAGGGGVIDRNWFAVVEKRAPVGARSGGCDISLLYVADDFEGSYTRFKFPVLAFKIPCSLAKIPCSVE